MIVAYSAALALTVGASLAMAWVLARHAGAVPGGRLLAMFVASVGVFAVGPLLLAVVGLPAARIAVALFGFVAVPAALYLHFVVRFTSGMGRATPGWLAGCGYGLAALATVAGFALGVGEVAPWRAFEAAFLPGWGGWVAIALLMVIAAAAHLWLLLALSQASPLQSRQIGIVLGAGVCGPLACSGLMFPAVGIDFDPWPVLLLPLYTAALAFGLLRYRLMAVNVWARRTVTWGLLVLVLGVGLAGAGSLAAASGLAGPLALSAIELWGLLAAVLLATLVLAGPLRRLADRLVFPGGQVDPARVATWRRTLSEAREWPDLAGAAEALLYQQFREPIRVTVGPNPEPPDPAGAEPALICRPEGGAWACALAGWHLAPPGPRQAGLVFAGVLGDAAERLAQAKALAAEAEARRRQAHLAELGQLAAIVAHDLRNPLNIIAMATAGADADLRAEVRTQLGRMDRLIADLLDYAGAWQVQPSPVLLAETARAAALGVPGLAVEIAVDPGLTVRADPHRLRQVFANLLANAAAAGGGDGEAPQARVAAEERGDRSLRIRVSDKGAGIPADLRGNLFQPFISGRADGTGLGLAIVARVVEAHGGRVALAEPEPGWTTCIVIDLPPNPSAPEAGHA